MAPKPAGEATRLRPRRARRTPRSAQERRPERSRPLYLGLPRVSTEEQAANGHSLDAQTEALRAEADRRDVDIEIIPVPGRTGRKVSQELRTALDRLARGEADGLMVTKLDRLVRSAATTDDIIKTAQQQGWNLVITSMAIDLSTAAGRMFAMVVAVYAEFERELISERTKEGLAAAKANGTRTGNPIGRPPLIPRSTVDRIIKLYTEHESFAEVARILTREGIPTPEHKQTWQPSTVRRIYDRSTQEG